MPDDKIGSSLGLEPIFEVLAPDDNFTPPAISSPSNQDEDYQYARENFYNVIEKGGQALEDMLAIAKGSEHPRAYEVISTIMKTLVDANKDLVEMGNKKIKNEGGGATGSDDQQSITNNVFVGSTAELQKLMKELKNGGPS